MHKESEKDLPLLQRSKQGDVPVFHIFHFCISCFTKQEVSLKVKRIPCLSSESRLVPADLGSSVFQYLIEMLMLTFV